MFNDQHTETDLMFKSILGNGQEEVPAHVWDGVASGLDRIARRKTAVLWLKRAAVGIAVAAAVIVGIILCHSTSALEQPDIQRIAVVAPDTVTIEDSIPETLAESVHKMRYTAYTPSILPQETVCEPAAELLSTQSEESAAVEEEVKKPHNTTQKKESTKDIVESRDIYNWDAEDISDQKKRIKASLVLSGITGGNTGQKAKSGIMRHPVSSSAPPKTGITEIGDNNRFGIPVSVGVGAKIDLNERWAIGAGVNYSLLTRKFSGEYLKVEEGTIVENIYSDIRNAQHYIGVPLNVYYNIIAKEKLNVYTYAGGAVEKCVSNKYQVLEKPITHKTKIQGVQLSANLGIGVEFMVSEHIGLYADPSARYYFNNRQPKSIRTSQPLMIGVEIGLRTRF